MATDPGSFQRPIDHSVGRTPDPKQPKLVTAATTLEWYENVVYVTPPSSSSYIITLPPYGAVPDGTEFLFYCQSTPGGEVRINNPAAGDVLGDNLSAVGDYAVIKKIGGVYAAIKEVTT